MCEGSASFAVDRDGVEGACGGREVLPIGLLTRLRSDRGRSCERVTGTGASDQRRSTRYGVKMDSGGPCRKTQKGRGEENIEVILVLRNTSTGCRLLNTTEAEQGRWG